nr:unnamed protein product [Callosobruchus chinensis]
MQSRGGQFNS